MPAYPPESTCRHQARLLSIIADAEPRLLLTIASFGDSLAQLENAPPVLSVDTLDAQIADSWRAPTCNPTTSSCTPWLHRVAEGRTSQPRQSGCQ